MIRNRRKPRRWFEPRTNVSDADGVDAIKDANATLGNRNHFDHEGYLLAKKMGWIRTDPPAERDEIDVED